MLKDRAQKALSLKFCVSKKWLPQLEIEVEPDTRVTKSKYMLTDIDVMGITPTTISGANKIIFDCKSGLRESAIGRSFWLSGVMTKTHANQGFIIMNNKINISHDHRISASEMNVTLVHESDFEDLAKCLDGTTTDSTSFVGDIDIWEEFFSISSKYPNLQVYQNFSRCNYWMLKDIGERCRKTVGKLRSVRTELDPEKPEHVAIFGDSVCLFLLTLAEFARRLYLILIKPTSKEDFSNTILAILYGGYENLEAAYKIKKLSSVNSDAHNSISIFPEMEAFELLIRETLESPSQVHDAALLAREMSFSALRTYQISPLEVELIKSSAFTIKFITLASEYLCKSAKLPMEFSHIYFNKLMYITNEYMKTNDIRKP